MSKIFRSPLSEGLEPYLAELGRIAPLREDEEAFVYQAAAEGCVESRERIVLSHLQLVVKIAYQYVGYGLPLTDLVSEGNIGLLRAAELFNPRFGVAFSTYAGVWIKQRMHRAITAQARVVRIPVWRSQRLRKLDRLHDDINTELGRDAELSELAERIGIPEADLAKIAGDRLSVDSLDAENGSQYGPLLKDESLPLPGDHLSRRELLEEIAACLQGLDDTELRILSLKFGLLDREPESYRAMAGRFGKSREWIRKIGEGALEKVKQSFRSAGDLPRALVQARKARAYDRLQRLAREHGPEEDGDRPAPSALSLFPVVLTESMELLKIAL